MNDDKQWTLRDFKHDLTVIDQGRRPNNIIFVVYHGDELVPPWRISQWHPDLENDTDRAMRAFIEAMIESRPSIAVMRNALHTYLSLLP